MACTTVDCGEVSPGGVLPVTSGIGALAGLVTIPPRASSAFPEMQRGRPGCGRRS